MSAAAPPPAANTAYTIFLADGGVERGAIEWPRKPGWRRIQAFMAPLIGAGHNFEHVSVLFQGALRDMFVDDMGAIWRLPRNEAATRIYRAHWLKHNPDSDPEKLPAIYGVAVLFHREVWL